MPVVTLTSDWNNYDYYLGSLKGKVLSLVPNANVVDLIHDVPLFKFTQAAFVIRNTYYQFPKGTVHLICVNSEPPKGKKQLIVQYDGHYFVCADNGMVGLVCNDDNKIEKVFEFINENEESTFQALEIYPLIVKAIAENNIAKVANESSGYDKHIPMRPVFEHSIISGSVIYIDTYRNAITNINRRLFDEVGKGRGFDIFVHSNHYKNQISRINKTYNETSPGELLAVFNSLGLLEIAIKDGKVVDLLSLNMNDVVRVKFKD